MSWVLGSRFDLAFIIQIPRTFRQAIEEMMCMQCLRTQPIGQYCTTPSCNRFCMAKYYCNICKLLDDSRYNTFSEMFLNISNCLIVAGVIHIKRYYSNICKLLDDKRYYTHILMNTIATSANYLMISIIHIH